MGMTEFSSLPCQMTPQLSGNPLIGDCSQAAVYSQFIDMRRRRLCALFSTFTGSPTGTLQLYGNVQPVQFGVASNDPSWMAIGSPVAISSAGTQVLDLVDTGCLYLMMVYLRSSGSGGLSVYIGNKG